MLLWKVFTRSLPEIRDAQFQSLFSWMLLWKIGISGWHHTRRRVSILVLLDVALKAGGDPRRQTGPRVSILVLLDVALKAKGEYLINPYILACFNPCSLGCCSERLFLLLCRRFYPVSILVLLDVALKGPGILPVAALMPVSILVLLDVALKGECVKVSPIAQIAFQSLFSWMLLWKEGPVDPPDLTYLLFQSLFSWMLLWKGKHPAYAFTYHKFQSLFSWMLLWKLPFPE